MYFLDMVLAIEAGLEITAVCLLQPQSARMVGYATLPTLFSFVRLPSLLDGAIFAVFSQFVVA